ncbi:hypothetical protein M3Y99_00106400 [Aphelenchoides fujianensis]|nr:hypothetical protein M3Y99_00106400 [Aphelenchoides fujianensis]
MVVSSRCLLAFVLLVLLLLVQQFAPANARYVYRQRPMMKRFYQWDNANGGPTVDPQNVLREAMMEKEAMEFIERSKDAGRMQKLRVFPG